MEGNNADAGAEVVVLAVIEMNMIVGRKEMIAEDGTLEGETVIAVTPLMKMTGVDPLIAKGEMKTDEIIQTMTLTAGGMNVAPRRSTNERGSIAAGAAVEVEVAAGNGIKEGKIRGETVVAARMIIQAHIENDPKNDTHPGHTHNKNMSSICIGSLLTFVYVSLRKSIQSITSKKV